MNYIFNNKDFSQRLLSRFLKYVQIWSESDGAAADKGIFPSTQRQFDFAQVLCTELTELGAKDVQLTKDCYVYARLPASKDQQEKPPILFLAHIDTVDEVTGKNVNPQVTKKGEDTIISTDKTTLLGADDKAGVSAIMTAAEYLLQNPQVSHREFEILFSPDEETGHGMDRVPLSLLRSKYAYTVDGGDEGELESECFNALSAKVLFKGKACHTGDARKNKMVNAVTTAGKFLSALPHTLTPETTDGYQGFIAPMDISGSIDSCEVNLLLRAFTTNEIQEEQKIVKAIAESTALSANASAEVTFKQQYLNMKEELDKHPEVLLELEKAYNAAGVKIIKKPIRGGTDGSRLTEMGIPTPNIFTGAHEFHSRNEWCSLNQMAKAADVIINLLTF